MTKSPENQLANASKTAIDTFQTLSDSTLSSAEKLATLNLGSARSGFDQQMGGIIALMNTRNFQDFIALQNTLTKPVLQNAINYCSKAYAIANESQEQLKTLAENSYEEMSKSVNSLLEQAIKTVPGGSDVATAALKSFMTAANTTYGKINEAARTATEIAHANIQASTHTASKVVGETKTETPAAKPAARKKSV